MMKMKTMLLVVEEVVEVAVMEAVFLDLPLILLVLL